uniref:Heparanase n=1 Tax=Sipha flava TaxID=143950 RepID=A0A2S2R6M5_9HEMI
MVNVIWLGALLLLYTCLTYSQNPSILLQPGPSSNILSLNINTKKCIHAVSDHFLSFTLEPSTIFLALQNNLGSTAINMAKSLNPAYVRISGPECNYFRFQDVQDTSQSSSIHVIKKGINNTTITGWHWSQLNEFVTKTGLDLIVALNVMNRQHGSWDLSNTLDLISYSDKHGYNMEFQIGNDLQTIESRIDGLSLGKDVTRLRKVLEAFPRYMNSKIISPDIKSCDTQEEAKYLKNFIVESDSSLSALTYQVSLSSEVNENPTEMFNFIQNQLESRVWQKDSINKYLGRIAVKKPLWIIESGNNNRRGDFTDGLIWAKRLCAGARVGINVIMRKPSALSLTEPTPVYWVSVLHKALIGTEVIDAKMSLGNKTRLETIVHCTKMSPYDPNEGIIAPEYRYNRGSITVFGVNMGSEAVQLSLKIGQKQSLPLHQYIMTANNRQHRKRAVKPITTMLNGQKLILSPDGDLPIISPKVRSSHKLITIPSQSVFFLVLPESKSKACMAIQIEESKESHKNGGRFSVDQEEFLEPDYESSSILDQEDESTSNEKNVYVAFRPKYIKTNYDSISQANRREEELKSYNNEIVQKNNENSRYSENMQQSEPVVKYITFSNNNWLSKFPKSLNNHEYSVELSTISPTEDTTVEMLIEKSTKPSQSRRGKYHVLAQAVAGKRHTEKNIRSDLYSNLDSAITNFKSSQKSKLIKRSVENSTLNSKEDENVADEFTNKEKPLSNPFSENDESFSGLYLKSNENNFKISERSKKEINSIVSEVQQPVITSQTTQQTIITSTPIMPIGIINQYSNIQSHVQKIKSRKEQALAKINGKNSHNERTSHKMNDRKSKDKLSEEAINPSEQKPITEKSITVDIEGVNTQKDSVNLGKVTSLADKLRYNRQTNNTILDNNHKTVIPRINIKLRKVLKNVDVENTNDLNTPIVETTHNEPSSTTEMSSHNTTKVRILTHVPKTLKLAKPKINFNEDELKSKKSIVRESRETTQHPGSKLKIKPISHPLGRVRTPSNVDVNQIVTNEKIAERLVENLKDGKKILQNEHTIVSPIKNNEETKLETKSISTTAAKIKAFEEKMKFRISERERKLHEKIHKHKKRSLLNNKVKDDIMDENDILNYDRLKSNEFDIDVDFVPVIKREINRYPRAVADFTVKLNEVNTYVDKNKRAKYSKNNGFTEDNGSDISEDWTKTNNISPLADDTEYDSVNIKSKRKSIFDELDKDDYSNNSKNMMNMLFSHMQSFWKCFKKTFQF